MRYPGAAAGGGAEEADSRQRPTGLHTALVETGHCGDMGTCVSPHSDGICRGSAYALDTVEWHVSVNPFLFPEK